MAHKAISALIVNDLVIANLLYLEGCVPVVKPRICVVVDPRVLHFASPSPAMSSVGPRRLQIHSPSLLERAHRQSQKVSVDHRSLASSWKEKTPGYWTFVSHRQATSGVQEAGLVPRTDDSRSSSAGERSAVRDVRALALLAPRLATAPI